MKLNSRWRALFCLVAVFSAAAAGAKDLLIHAGTLIDGISGAPRRQVSILVRDDKILSIEPGFVSAAGADLIDLSTATVMPGFIDCHIHMSALFAATRNAADLLGAADRVGSVQAGRYADLVATAGNPLDDPDQFKHVSFVMKGGMVYRRNGVETIPAPN